MSTDILERPASPTIRLTAWLLAAMVVLIVVGSSYRPPAMPSEAP